MSRTHTIVIVGMHRSGTSCLAGCLRAGLGLETVALWGPDNPGGHHEDPEVVALNESVLAESGGSWSRVPSSLRWSDRLTARRNELLARWQREPSWRVVKDPRLPIVWPFWEGAFGELPTVAIVRHPVPVLDSLLTRGDEISQVDALQLWIASCRRVLSLAAGGVPIVEFGPHVPLSRGQLAALVATWRELGFGSIADCVDLGLASAEAVAGWLHHAPSGWEGRGLPQELIDTAESIYETIRARALAADDQKPTVEQVIGGSRSWLADVARAVDRASASDVDAAIDALDRAAQGAPNPELLRLRAAELAQKSGRAAEALTRCEDALAQAPSPWWQLLRARCLMDLDRHEQAVAILDELTAAPPILVSAYRLRLIALSRLERWKRMLEVSDDIAGDGSPWIVRGLRAEALLRSGNAAAAETLFEGACAMAPTSAVAQLRLRWADALVAMNDLAEAEAIYRSLLAGETPPFHAFKGQVRLLRRRGDSEGALSVAEAACAAYPALVWPHWQACELAQKLGRHEAAAGHWGAAASIEPDHPETARLLSRQTDLEQASERDERS